MPENLQKRLELTLKASAESAKKANNQYQYQYLLCVNVLQMFCFNIGTFLFEYDLLVEDFRAMTEMLDTHLKIFEKLQEIRDKQAYLFQLALLCLNDRNTALQHTIDEMPGGLCPEAEKACFRHRHDENAIDLEELDTFCRKRMEVCNLRVDWKMLFYSVKSQLHFLHCPNLIKSTTNDFINEPLDKSVQKLLRAMDMEKYYPQKLKYEDVLMLSSDVYNDINKKPTTLPELPWYFMKHVIELDSDTRENCHIPKMHDDEEEDNNSETDNDELEDSNMETESTEEEYSETESLTYSDDESNDEGVHPLDLVYIVFLCADDFLRQELANKLARCQYAVPFIIPPPQQDKHREGNILLYWALENYISHIL